MPNFTYKCEDGHTQQLFYQGLAPVRRECGVGGCKKGTRTVFNPNALPQTLRRYRDRVTGPEYREDLARFPGDRRAIVTGERDLKRLINTTRKEVEDTGGIVRPISEAAFTPPDPAEEAAEENLLEEAYLDALQELKED